MILLKNPLTDSDSAIASVIVMAGVTVVLQVAGVDLLDAFWRYTMTSWETISCYSNSKVDSG